MKFLTNVIGHPIQTDRPLRSGSYSLAVTTKGFVVGDPEAFGISKLIQESASLRTGSGYLNGHLHLQSKHFPMYYPGCSPRLLLVSQKLTVMPLRLVPQPLQSQLEKPLLSVPDFVHADPEILVNVLPCFEIFQDGLLLATA